MTLDQAVKILLLTPLLGGPVARGQTPPCTPAIAPEAQRALENGTVATRLGGRYAISVIALSRETDDTIVQGILELHVGKSGAPSYWGWTDVDFMRFGPSSQLYSPGSKDPRRPGVFSLIDRPSGRLTFVAGGLENDRGLILTVLSVDSSHFAGSWADGSLRRKRIHGYFCATRE